MGYFMRSLRPIAVITAVALCTSVATPQASAHRPPHDVKQPVATGTGGAVASAEFNASKAGIDVLRSGGNAIDAAVAVAGTLGVTEPFVAGPGGGGFMVIYLARTHQVVTIDGREMCPSACTPQLFIDPSTGKPLAFEEARHSGLSVGVPGMVATWAKAVSDYGRRSFGSDLQPAIQVAQQGFTITPDFVQQEQASLPDLQAFTSSRKLFLTADGQPLPVGSTLRNPDLARTYQQLAAHGPSYLYGGPLGSQIAQTVQHPPVWPGTPLTVRPGIMTASDVANYTAKNREPTHVAYRGLDVYGMAPPSSGGITTGEALNILSGFDLSSEPRATALFHYLEASRLAFGRPQRLHRRLRLRTGSAARPARPRVRGHPSLPHRLHRADLAGRTRNAVPAVLGMPDRVRGRQPGARGHRDQPPRRRRQVGQRRQLHQHHRTARRQRHHRSRPRLPAQQRDDRLRLRAGNAQHLRSEPARTGQAAAFEHEPHDRAEERRARFHRRLAGRLDHHHHSAADPAQPRRLRDDLAGGDRRTAR